jgi:hypothetical protein
MAITYPLALPTFRVVNSFRFGLARSAAVSRSPFTGTEQVYEWPAASWSAGFDVMAKTPAEWAQLDGFIAALRGRVGTVLIGPRHVPRPSGTAATAGVTAGAASAGARVLSLSGLGNARTLAAGDFLQLGSGATARLYCVSEPATSSAGGAASVSIEPPLRAAVTGGSAVTLARPATVMRSVAGEISVDLQPGGLRMASFGFVEAL